MAHKTQIKRIAACTLALMLALSFAAWPRVTRADTAQELEERLELAKSTLEELGMQVMAAGETLYETQYALDQTNLQIEDANTEVENKTRKLEETKEALARRVKASYKAGQTSPLAIFLDEEGFEKLSSYPYYANKMAAQDLQVIDEVTEAKAALEKQIVDLEQLKTEQEELVSKQEIQFQAFQVAQAAQSEYVNNLDEALRDRLNADNERELLEQRAEAGDEQARLELELAAEQEAQQIEAPELNVPAGTNVNVNDITGNARSTMSSSTRMKILNAAFSQIGVPYLWGGEQPGVGLDCSGFTQYCYRQAGIELPHSARAQAHMSRASSIEKLQPGDLVFWLGASGAATGDHVAMYLGGGNIIHESPGGVRIVPLFGGYTKFGVII